MKRGEVWRVRLPAVPGHTQSGERPGLIVQADSFNASLPTALVVPFTSTLAANRFSGTLLVQPDSQNGLTIPSVALVFQLSAADRRNCLRPLGQVDQSVLDQIFALMDKLTGR